MTFQSKPRKAMKRARMKPGKGFKPPVSCLQQRKPMNKVGPKTDKWLRVWRWLKPKLEVAGRTMCEFDFIPHYCWGRLDPCHSKKRRLWEGNDIYAVAIGCQNIHQVLDEILTHEQMEERVLTAIERHGGLILPEVKA